MKFWDKVVFRIGLVIYEFIFCYGIIVILNNKYRKVG